MNKVISKEILSKFKDDFNKNKSLLISKNAVMKNGVFNSAFNSEEIKNIPFTFNNEVKDIGSITNQKQSGRCWMFSGLNVLRISAMKKLGVKDFEFSETYLMFFDKLEKSNFMLEKVFETLDEKSDSRLLEAVLSSGGSQDGGFWSFFVSLIKKYGICPKEVMGESNPSSSSMEMDMILEHKLRQDAALLRNKYKDGTSLEELKSLKEGMLSEIYKILTICLGTPVEEFEYEWKSTPVDEDDKDKKEDDKKETWKHFKGTPLEFYKEFVGVDLDEYILITNAPIKELKEYQKYSLDLAINVIEDSIDTFITVPLDVLKETAIKSIKNDEAMWFDCDVGALSLRKDGYLDDKMLSLDVLFDSDFSFDKGDSLLYKNTAPNHAMVLAGVNLDENNKPNRWKVENSWGGDVGKSGIYVMSDSWFDRFVYGIVVKKKFVNEDILKANEKEAILLPAWSPIGLKK